MVFWRPQTIVEAGKCILKRYRGDEDSVVAEMQNKGGKWRNTEIQKCRKQKVRRSKGQNVKDHNHKTRLRTVANLYGALNRRGSRKDKPKDTEIAGYTV